MVPLRGFLCLSLLADPEPDGCKKQRDRRECHHPFSKQILVQMSHLHSPRRVAVEGG